MRALLLARRALAHHKGRTSILCACVVLTMLLPLAVEGLVMVFGDRLQSRAGATPLVVGAKGSRFDLVLNTLYFRGRVPEAVPIGALDEVRRDGLAEPIPILARDTARGWPLVGTTPEYFRFRGLRAAAGELPLSIGECVLGAEVAARERLAAGDRILSDRKSLYAIDEGYPLRMRIVGVLERSDGPDDAAVFTSLETVWIAEGLGHGHDEASAQDPASVLGRDGQRVVLDSSIVEFQEVTPENADSFHFHGRSAELPVTAIIALPRDAKAATILKGRYRVAEGVQLLEPREVIAEILDLVLRLKTFFDANVLLVGVATALFLALVVALSVRVRQREIETLVRIGASRGAVVRLFAVEFGLVLAASAVTAAAIAAVAVVVLADRLAPWL